MNTTQNVKQFKDHEALVQKGKSAVSANQQDWDTITALNQCLAHSIELGSRIKQAHWSAKGENFYVFQKMADDFTIQLARQSDKLSARIVAVEGVPKWTPDKVADTSQLPAYPNDLFKVADHIQALATNYEQVIDQLKTVMIKAAKSDDYVTVNVMTGFKKTLDEQKSFLFAHSGLAWLERPKRQSA
jgi:starvation-inducible DNA-binding protein